MLMKNEQVIILGDEILGVLSFQRNSVMPLLMYCSTNNINLSSNTPTPIFLHKDERIDRFLACFSHLVKILLRDEKNTYQKL